MFNRHRTAKAAFGLSAALLTVAATGSVHAQDAGKTPTVTVTAPHYAKGIAPVEAFARLPAKSSVVISPGGKRLAWIDGTSLVVFDLDTGEQNTLGGGANTPVSVEWAGDDYIILRIRNQQRLDYYDQLIDFATYLVVDAKAKYVGPLFADYGSKKPSPSGSVLRVVDGEDPYVFVQGIDSNTYRPGMSTNSDSVVPTIYKVYLKTGKKEVAERGTPDTAYWSLDANGIGRVRVETFQDRVNYSALRVRVQVRKTPDGKYEDFVVDRKPDTILRSFKYSSEDNSVFWTEYNEKTNRSEVYYRSINGGETKLFNGVDGPGISVLMEQKTGKRIGVATYGDNASFEWTDPFYKSTYALLEKALPGRQVTVEDYTDDKSLMVVSADAPDAPTVYYLYDTNAKSLDIIGETYPELVGARLGKMKFITYKASDGLEIPAYITKREDIKSPAPLVLVVHGGPAARDYYGYDYWTQYLANQGYVVLQPQYRGSSGFGDAFQKAGDKNLHRMIEDSVDGVKYLVDQGLVDPKRVCITGWSWGGYSTMAAMTMFPDVWKCGVEGAGVADPETMINWVSGRAGGHGEKNSALNYWISVMGDPRSEGGLVKDGSPLRNLANLKAPMLLVHGENDTTVPIEQSELMWKAMQKAGKEGKFVRLPDEDHHITLQKSRLVFLTEMGAFLKAHLDPDLQK